MRNIQYIEKDPRHPGSGQARIAGYGIPVWAVIGHWQAVNGSTTRVAEDYELPLEAVEAALRYYKDHKKAIDARLESNADCFA